MAIYSDRDDITLFRGHDIVMILYLTCNLFDSHGRLSIMVELENKNEEGHNVV